MHSLSNTIFEYGSGHASPLVYESKLNGFRILVIIRTLLSDRMGYTAILANFTFSRGWAKTASLLYGK